MTGVAGAVVLVVLAAAVEALAQTFLKISRGATSSAARWIAIGLATYAIEIVMYTMALQRIDVSVAFPLQALSFVFVTALGCWPLRERVGVRRWIGSLLIVGGAALISLDVTG